MAIETQNALVTPEWYGGHDTPVDSPRKIYHYRLSRSDGYGIRGYPKAAMSMGNSGIVQSNAPKVSQGLCPWRQEWKSEIRLSVHV